MQIINIGCLASQSSDTLVGLRNSAAWQLTKLLPDQLVPPSYASYAVDPGVVVKSHLEELFAEMANESGKIDKDI